jgi:branched-chain amino acid transport system ATP-binding protein
LIALKDISFQVKEKELIGLIGPNGSGKSTLFNCINGFYKPSKGKIIFIGKEINGLSPQKICKLGIGRTFQVPRPFKNLTVIENVAVAAAFGKNSELPLKKAYEKALYWLEFLGLVGKKDVLVKDLTFVDVKMVEIARALATEPKLLLLDEPLSGLNPSEVLRAVEMVKKIRDMHEITILWIEHVMRAIMSAADRIVVLHHGEKISEGKPSEIATDEKVVSAYLGRKL